MRGIQTINQIHVRPGRGRDGIGQSDYLEVLKTIDKVHVRPGEG